MAINNRVTGAKSAQITLFEAVVSRDIAENTAITMAGRDIPGEPGNRVPTKSLVSSEIFARHHAFLSEGR